MRARPLLERFEEKVSPEPNTGCWLWTASVDWAGYGQIGDGRGGRKAHRVAWELFVGPIPRGLGVLHRCDQPSCVNPAHLFLGTQTDNNRDRHQKGRSGAPLGEAQGHAKLTESIVRECRRSYEAREATHRELAVSFRVAHCTMWRVVTRQAWRHVL